MNSFSAVSLTPAINFRLFGYFWPVSTTEVCSFCKTANRCCRWQDSDISRCWDQTRPSMLSLELPWIRCIHRYLTHPEQMPLRSLRWPKLLLTITAISPVANSFIVSLKLQRKVASIDTSQIYRQYQRHWRSQKIRQCRWHRWLTLIPEYPREFSEKFETAPMEYSEAGGTLIHEKTEVENLVSDSL